MIVRVGQKVKFDKELPNTKKIYGISSAMLRKVSGEDYLRIKASGDQYVYIEGDTSVYSIKDIIAVDDTLDKYSDVETKHLTKVEDVFELAKTIYGEDRVIFGEDEDVIIHFPELEIRNSKGRKHTIYDMYFSIQVTKSSLEDIEDGSPEINVDVCAIRSTFSLAEVMSSYTHSHISSGNFLNWGNFCTGSNTPFKMLLSDLPFNPTVENWELFLMSIKRFLEWESLEGGPYMRIENIRVGTSNNNELLELELQRMLPSIPFECVEYDTHFYFKENQEFIDWVNENSNIRDVSDIGNTNLPQLRESQLKFIHTRYGKSIKIGKNEIDIKILPIEENKKVSIKPVSKDIVIFYLTSLNKNSKQFYKMITYDRAKKYQETFKEIGII